MTDKSTLSVGQYTIELSSGASQVYSIDTENKKHWVCSTVDPDLAMKIVEGLIMVEMKRFYYPQSQPKINKGEKPIVPFLNKD